VISEPDPRRSWRAWLQLREGRLRSFHFKVEQARLGFDQAVLACQQKQAEQVQLKLRRQALRAWCAGPGAKTGPAGLAVARAHDELLADREERTECAWLDLMKARQFAEQTLMEARAHWLNALRQQHAARRWLADLERRSAALTLERSETEWLEDRSPGRQDSADTVGGAS
jgi:hypothetical protein